jgi:hypothetical protein
MYKCNFWKGKTVLMDDLPLCISFVPSAFSSVTAWNKDGPYLKLRIFTFVLLCRIQIRMRVYSKVSGLSHKEIYAYKNKHSLRSNTKGYGGKTH